MFQRSSTDHAELLLHRDFCWGQNGEPIAVKTALGWVLMGGKKSVGEKGLCNFISNSLTNIDEKIQNFWKLNSYGTLPKIPPKLLPPKEKRSLEIQQRFWKILKDSDVTLLIGTDHADLLLHRDFCQGQNGEPTAVKTALGWVLMGGKKSIGEKGLCNFISNSLTSNVNNGQSSDKSDCFYVAVGHLIIEI